MFANAISGRGPMHLRNASQPRIPAILGKDLKNDCGCLQAGHTVGRSARCT
jgi:hypothetical protein